MASEGAVTTPRRRTRDLTITRYSAVRWSYSCCPGKCAVELAGRCGSAHTSNDNLGQHMGCLLTIEATLECHHVTSNCSFSFAQPDYNVGEIQYSHWVKRRSAGILSPPAL
jgi:hypothetical protein